MKLRSTTEVYALYRSFLDEVARDTPGEPQVTPVTAEVFAQRWATVSRDPELREKWLALFTQGYAAAKAGAVQLFERELAALSDG